ncbi:PREDICTED: zinc finger protein OZF-like, partial [Wasmannia auropunctata]|uniref:zinc finger protein OZF-like n=1 Tax=Wasmannia auropunctata TaxID=64793 RepID=UPI0005EE3953
MVTLLGRSCAVRVCTFTISIYCLFLFFTLNLLICFRSNQSKSYHVQRAHKKKEYVCDLCKKCFSSHNSRWNHVQREHKKKEYICDQCGKCFSSYQSKWRHAQYHKKENLVCDYCGKFFSSYKSKWNHVQREHQKKEYVCDQCGKCFNSYSSRWHHVQREHKKKEYVCDQCGKCYSTKKNLRYHISTHLPVETRKYQCDICQKNSRHLASMKRHRILKHFKNKNKHAKNTLSKNILCNRENFVCDYCGKCFSDKSKLCVHISTHLRVEDRKYQCDICQKKFITNSNLTVHKRIHSGVRPYKCDVCSFSFRHTDSLKRHRMAKHFKNENKHAKNTLPKNILCNREYFVCDYCGKCF